MVGQACLPLDSYALSVLSLELQCDSRQGHSYLVTDHPSQVIFRLALVELEHPRGCYQELL